MTTYSWRAVVLLSAGALVSWILLAIVRPAPAAPPPAPCEFSPAPIALPPAADDLTRRLQRAERWWEQAQVRLASAPLPATEQAVTAGLDAAFEPVYASVPAFLNWHFSIGGQYAQLGIAAAGGLRRFLASRAVDGADPTLQDQLVDQLQRSLAPLLDQIVERLQPEVESQLVAQLPERLEGAAAAIERIMQQEVRALLAEWTRDETRQAALDLQPDDASGQQAAADPDRERGRVSPCARERRRARAGAFGPEIRMDSAGLLDITAPRAVRRFTASVVPSGIVGGAVGIRAALGARAAVVALGRAVTRTLTRSAERTVLGAAGRAASRWIAATGGAAGGGLGALLGGAAWLAIDGISINVDEYLHRDDLEKELIAAIDERKDAITRAMTGEIAALRAELSNPVRGAGPRPLGPVTPDDMDRG